MSIVLYERDGRLARITLNRPEKLNAIDTEMPRAIAAAVERANGDDDVHAIVLSGAGRAFCAGYDLELFAENPEPEFGTQKMPWDPMLDYRLMSENTRNFMSLWRGYKPTICKVQGYAVAGGSDIALCCDIVVMADDARIGYPPARVWGCPTTMMWVHRVGVSHAKRLLLTGDTIDGLEAARIGLVTQSVPAEQLDDAVEGLAHRVASVPLNQLMMHKLVVNQAYDNMGLASSQLLATVFDGIARHTPEGLAFKRRAEEVGLKEAVRERDS